MKRCWFYVLLAAICDLGPASATEAIQIRPLADFHLPPRIGVSANPASLWKTF